VVRVALENAVSAARTLLLTDATMTELPDTAREPAAEAGMAMGVQSGCFLDDDLLIRSGRERATAT
jgi:hypothetical protein